jgi:hypothetical protein
MQAVSADMHKALLLSSPPFPAGIFGMNLTSGLERWDPYSLWGVVSVGLVLGLTAMLSFGLYAKRKGILNVPAFGLERAAGTINSSAGAMAGGLP